MKLDEEKVYTKILAIDAIYKFIVDNFLFEAV
jgi:hypothetical protein